MVASKQHAFHCFEAVLGELNGSVVQEYNQTDEL